MDAAFEPPQITAREVFRNLQPKGTASAVWAMFTDDGRAYSVEVSYEDQFMQIIRMPGKVAP